MDIGKANTAVALIDPHDDVLSEEGESWGADIEVSRAASGKVNRDELISALMVTALEQAGSGRGLLIPPNGDELQIKAKARTVGNMMEVNLP
jgi:hypothetical protein